MEAKMLKSKRLNKRSKDIHINEIISQLFSEGCMETIRHCPICTETTFSEALTRYDRNGIPCLNVECLECGIIFQKTYLNENAMSQNYASYSRILRGKPVENKAAMHDLFEVRSNKFATPRFNAILERMNLSKTDLIIELGCNDGANLMPFHTNGFTNLVGYDLDESSFDIGKAYGLDLRCQNILNFNFTQQKKPKLIILSHVLEHLPNPVPFLNKIYEIIDDDGTVYIEVPGLKSPHWVNIRNGIVTYFQFEHILNFEKQSLENLISKTPFKILDINEYINLYLVKNQNGRTVDFKKAESALYLKQLESKYLRSPWRMKTLLMNHFKRKK